MGLRPLIKVGLVASLFKAFFFLTFFVGFSISHESEQIKIAVSFVIVSLLAPEMVYIYNSKISSIIFIFEE